MDLVEHLISRHMNPKNYKGLVLDHESNLVTAYLYNLSGQIVGYQQYNPLSKDKHTNVPRDARYFTYRNPQSVAVWGLETLNPSLPVCFIVEGTFKASVIHSVGYNAVALLTSTPDKSTLAWLRSLPYKLVALGDNDPAGEKLVRTIGCGRTTQQDLDEMDPVDVNNLCVSYL